MSPAVADFQSPSSSTQLPVFLNLNPNPSVHKHPSGSNAFNHSLNLMESSKLEFNCSNGTAGAAGIRSSRRKHVKVKRQSNFGDSVSKEPINDSANTMNFVFNTNTSGSVLNSSLGRAKSNVGSESDNFSEVGLMTGASDGKLNVGSEEVHNNGNVGLKGDGELHPPSNSSFVFGTNGNAETNKISGTVSDEIGKVNGVNFALGLDVSNGVMNSNTSNEGQGNGLSSVGTLHVEDTESIGMEKGLGDCVSKNFNDLPFEVNSVLVSSMSGLNLKTGGQHEEVGPSINESLIAEEKDTQDCRNFENLDFVFSANYGDIGAYSNLQKESKGKVGKSVQKGRGKVKLDPKVVFSTSGDARFIYSNGSNDSASNSTSDRLESNGNAEKSEFSHSEHMKTMQSSRIFDSTGLMFGDNSSGMTLTKELGKKESSTSYEQVNIGDSVGRNIDSGIEFQNSEVSGVFHTGHHNDSFSISGSRIFADGIKNLSEGAENFCDSLKKQVNNMESVLDGKFTFVFGRNKLGSAFSNSPLFNVSDATRTLNIPDPTEVSGTDKTKDSNNDSCVNFNNIFVFGSGQKNVSSSGISATTSSYQLKGANLAGLWSGNTGQRTDGVDEVSPLENNEKCNRVSKVPAHRTPEMCAGSHNVGVQNGELNSSRIFRNENHETSSDGVQCFGYQPKNYTELNKDSFTFSPSSSSKVDCSEVHLTNKVEMTNTFSFKSTLGGFGVSFTGLSTPDVNMESTFKANMYPGSSKNQKSGTLNSVGGRKLKKAKAKLRHQTMGCQQGGQAHLSKAGNSQSIQESPGCSSPMDVSPYQSADCVSTSTNHSVSSEVEAVHNNAEKLSQTKVSSSSSRTFAHDDAPAKHRPRQKKYKMKTGCGLESNNPKQRADASCAHEHTSQDHMEAADQAACDKWRARGNQAYRNGDLSKAEGYYTKGINSVPYTKMSTFYIEPLLLCYSNRAATQMALGRLREGLEDCRMAAGLDPNFVKANLRAANCYLLLGEVEDAFCNYNKCLESGDKVCLDRKIAIEAADGLQKAQKVVDCLKLSSELLQQKTLDSATKALGMIADALYISPYSEKLLEMKGQALFLLQKHEEVVQLCEKTLDSAERNFATVDVIGEMNADGFDGKTLLMLWRLYLMSKSYFHLGRLDTALDLIEKHGQLRPTVDKYGSMAQESLVPLAVTVRELLQCKNAGNESFRCGRHTEAVEHYTATITKSIESHPFAAVCFCNRAAAHQSLGEIIDAIGDCSIAIALDGSYSKALSRRATLHEMIRDYNQAAIDLQRLISILETQSGEKSQNSGTSEKSTGCSVKDLRRARRRLSSVGEKAKWERPLDLYLILGVKASDASSEVKKAYHKAALRHHPDKAGQILARAENGSNGQQWKEIAETVHTDADRLFKLIGEAYAVLSDSTKRSKYDLEEEMWDDKGTNVSGSVRRASEFYSSPFESSNRRNSQESRRTYGNSHYYHWQESRRNSGDSCPRW